MFPVKLRCSKVRECMVCAQLSRQLGADDFLSGATIEANESMLRAAMGKRFDKLAELIENYDFGGALSLLQTFAQQQGTTV